jgi:hypothetical protein
MDGMIGHNNPPDPIELVIAEYDDVITEAQNWADGEPVTDEASMKAVDEIIKGFKSYRSALTKAGKERTDPLHKAWKAEVAAVKVYTDDADMMQSALVALLAPYKVKLAEEKKAAERAAWEAAEKARREAEAKAAAANAADIEAQREAMAAKQAAMDAQKAAQAQSKDKVKGLRTVTKWEITDYSDMLRWLNKNDRPALEAFCNEYARRCHKNGSAIAGVRVWEEKEAF